MSRKNAAMIFCPACAHPFALQRATCPNCRLPLPRTNGFIDLRGPAASDGASYNPAWLETIAQIQETHFWFAARRKLIGDMVQRYRPGFASFLEMGCGTGDIAAMLQAKWPQRRIMGSEIHPEGLTIAAQRVPPERLMLLDALHMPFFQEFELLGAFDVIEHIKDDTAVLHNLHQALQKGGLLLLTIPQHPWLWSETDARSGHYRRYKAAALHQLLQQNGFRILRSTSFVSLVLPLMLASRWKNRIASNSDPAEDLRVPRWANTLLQHMLQLEHGILGHGWDLPLGGSRLVVAEKA